MYDISLVYRLFHTTFETGLQQKHQLLVYIVFHVLPFLDTGISKVVTCNKPTTKDVLLRFLVDEENFDYFFDVGKKPWSNLFLKQRQASQGKWPSSKNLKWILKNLWEIHVQYTPYNTSPSVRHCFNFQKTLECKSRPCKFNPELEKIILIIMR